MQHNAKNNKLGIDNFVPKIPLKSEFLEERLSMRQSSLIIFAFLLLGFFTTANAFQHYSMQVSDILQMVDGHPLSPPPQAWSPELTRRVAKENALLYVYGVIDSGEGLKWCTAKSKVIPPERYEIVFSSLRDNKAKDANAALAIGVLLAKYFPCHGEGAKYKHPDF